MMMMMMMATDNASLFDNDGGCHVVVIAMTVAPNALNAPPANRHLSSGQQKGSPIPFFSNVATAFGIHPWLDWYVK